MPKKNTLQPTIHIPRPLIAKFRSRALSSKNEVLAFLIGTITKENDIITQINVEELFYPPVTAGVDFVQWRPQDIIKLQAHILPRSIVGSIHSHPGYEPHISREDILTSEQFGDVVSGVFSYWKDKGQGRRKTSLDWYYGMRVLKCRLY